MKSGYGDFGTEVEPELAERLLPDQVTKTDGLHRLESRRKNIVIQYRATIFAVLNVLQALIIGFLIFLRPEIRDSSLVTYSEEVFLLAYRDLD